MVSKEQIVITPVTEFDQFSNRVKEVMESTIEEIVRQVNDALTSIRKRVEDIKKYQEELDGRIYDREEYSSEVNDKLEALDERVEDLAQVVNFLKNGKENV